MLSFKDLQEVLQPKAAGEKRFKDKHVADTIDYPLNDAEINKGTKKSPAKKKRIADSEEGKDAAVYEELEQLEQDDLNDLMQYALDEGLNFHELTEEQLDELIAGLIKKGVKKVGGAIKGRVTTSGRADRLKKKATALQKKRDDKNTIRKSKIDIRKAKSGIKRDARSGTDNREMARKRLQKAQARRNEEMTPDQEKKREEIVMAMKKDKEKLQSRYGESWKAVMYATATKQAMSESFELDEALNPKDKKVVDAFYDGKSMDGKMLSTDGKKLEKTGMGGQTIASKSGNKFKIVAKMDSKSTQDVVKYIEKSFPKNVIEEVELDEALPPHLAKYIGKDGDFTPEVKKRLGKDSMKRMQVPSKKKSNVKDVTPKGYGPDEELDESAAGIAQLKKAYEPLRDKKISLDNAKKLSAIMDKFADDKAMLMKLVKADIPFVTQSAVTKLITKHNMKGAEINKMMKEERALTTDARYKTFREKLLKLGYQKADIDEKAPKIKFDDIMNRKEKPKTYQVDIDGGRATVTAASEKMAIQKAMTQMKINKSIKPLPKATVKVMEEVDLDEAFKINPVNVKLDDGSMVKISKDDASALNGLYNSLNPANAKTMIKKMMQDKKTYGEILAFANQAM
jgi:hypothetical protein